MKKTKRIFIYTFWIVALAAVIGIFLAACSSLGTSIAGDILTIGSEPRFPSSFIGTWVRETPGNLNSTREFTATTFKISSQSATWTLAERSGDRYTLAVGNTKATETFRYRNGKLVVSGCTGNGENNCNGTWIRKD